MCIDHLTGRWKVTVCSYVLQRNMSHIHLCIFCVICLIFISKWDPFRNKSYQRETILKINRYLFTFWKYLQSTTHWRGCMYNASHFGVWLEKKRKKRKEKEKKKKKRKSRDSNPRQSSQCFRGIRLVQSATEACYFNVKKNRLISVCLLYVTKHDQT